MDCALVVREQTPTPHGPPRWWGLSPEPVEKCHHVAPARLTRKANHSHMLPAKNTEPNGVDTESALTTRLSPAAARRCVCLVGPSPPHKVRQSRLPRRQRRARNKHAPARSLQPNYCRAFDLRGPSPNPSAGDPAPQKTGLRHDPWPGLRGGERPVADS